MAEPLLPATELAPPLDPNTTPQQCIAIWVDLLRSGFKLLLAGLRREVGPQGDVNGAFRKWYAEQMDEHDKTVIRMLQRMTRREGAHGG